ncbi:MAG: hypothetical protein JW874_04165 [Spirochaetales bacterium]|nr:hypothetical protein [Spirochaetales bacterium]
MLDSHTTGVKIIALFFLIFVFTGLVSAQAINMDQIRAQEEFRWGVQAYHNGLFSEAIRSFELSLSLVADDPLTTFWLGLAYYRAGMNDVAISLWQNLVDRGQARSYIENYIDILRVRSGLERELHGSDNYVEAYKLTGKTESYNTFYRPASILAAPDGGFYLSSFVTNDIIKFSANGELSRRINGGLEGFDHPFDLLAAENGYMYISEFSGDRIARCLPDGSKLTRFGSTGSGDGQFLGPQFMAADGAGYIYISDIGNRRISKFDLDGNFLFHFGRRNSFFTGLKEPTGVAIVGGFVYVADSLRADISVFDESGNYLKSVGKGFLHKPEGLTVTAREQLLVADTDRVVRLDPQTEKLEIISDLGGDAGKIVKAVYDVNRHMLAADFEKNEVSVLTDIMNMPAGLHVQTMMINATDFPLVRAEVAVQDRLGNPFTGLEVRNFRISENNILPDEIKLVYAADREQKLSLSLLADRSRAAAQLQKEIKDAAETVYGFISENRGSGQVVSAAELPVLETPRNASRSEFIAAAIKKQGYSANWSIDRGLLMAASELVNTPGKRAVILPYAGDIGRSAFTAYSLSVISQFFRNNGIRFYCFYLKPVQESYSEELEYLCRETGGKAFYLYQSEGVTEVAEDLRNSLTGRYVLEYNSKAQTDFGRRYIPVKIEAHIYARSGRDETGFFAPLEF